MRRIAVMLLGVATVGATAWALNANGQKAASSAAVGAMPPAADRVVSAPGRVEPFSEEIQMGVEVPGRLARVFVDEGQTVRRGDILAEIDNADARARVASAVARLAGAEAEYQRLINGARAEERREADAQRRQAEAVWMQTDTEQRRRAALYQHGAIALEEAERADRDARQARARLDEATERARLVSADPRDDDRARAAAAVRLARATVDEAEAIVAKTIVRAPQDATVLRRFRRTGELVAPDTGPVFTLADTSRLRVRAEVDETDVARISVGQSVWIRADAYGDRRFTGRVARIGLALGRKTIRTERPTDRNDTAVLETLVDLEAGVQLPVGLRVDVFIGGR